MLEDFNNYCLTLFHLNFGYWTLDMESGHVEAKS